jgi:hypothetical protein
LISQRCEVVRGFTKHLKDQALLAAHLIESHLQVASLQLAEEWIPGSLYTAQTTLQSRLCVTQQAQCWGKNIALLWNIWVSDGNIRGMTIKFANSSPCACLAAVDRNLSRVW